MKLQARHPALAIDRSRRTASFTTMVAERERPRGGASEGRDRDEHEDDGPELSPPDTAEGQVPLAAFPRGAKAGNFFHECSRTSTFGPPPMSARRCSTPSSPRMATPGTTGRRRSTRRWRGCCAPRYAGTISPCACVT